MLVPTDHVSLVVVTNSNFDLTCKKKHEHTYNDRMRFIEGNNNFGRVCWVQYAYAQVGFGGRI